MVSTQGTRGRMEVSTEGGVAIGVQDCKGVYTLVFPIHIMVDADLSGYVKVVAWTRRDDLAFP